MNSKGGHNGWGGEKSRSRTADSQKFPSTQRQEARLLRPIQQPGPPTRLRRRRSLVEQLMASDLFLPRKTPTAALTWTTCATRQPATLSPGPLKLSQPATPTRKSRL